MTQSLEAALKAMRHIKSQRVFCNADGKPLSIYQLHERLWGACRRAGLRKIRWHDCRHSFASQLVIAGVPIRQVQEWLGHSTILMTMRYSHLAPDGGHEHIAVLDDASAKVKADKWQTARSKSGSD
jgi:site-specific recombinase XerD